MYFFNCIFQAKFSKQDLKMYLQVVRTSVDRKRID